MLNFGCCWPGWWLLSCMDARAKQLCGWQRLRPNEKVHRNIGPAWSRRIHFANIQRFTWSIQFNMECWIDSTTWRNSIVVPTINGKPIKIQNYPPPSPSPSPNLSHPHAQHIATKVIIIAAQFDESKPLEWANPIPNALENRRKLHSTSWAIWSRHGKLLLLLLQQLPKRIFFFIVFGFRADLGAAHRRYVYRANESSKTENAI